MNYVEKFDKAIFYCLCAYALTSCIMGDLADNFIGLGVLLGILSCIKKRPKINVPREYVRALLVFFGVFFLMIFISTDMARSAREYWRYLNRMFPFLLALFFLSRGKQVVWIGICLLVSVTVNNGYAIYKQIVLLQSQGVWGRASGFFSEYYINLAGVLLLTIPSLVILLFSSKLRLMNKLLLTLVLAVSFIALFMNETRVAWGIIVFILLLLPFILMKSWKKAIGFSCIVVVFCVAIIGSVPSVHSRVMSIFDTQQASNRGHYFITIDDIRMIKDHPFFGVGLGRFQKVFNEAYISPQTKAIEPFVTHAHDNTLHMLAQTGVVGCAAFWYMFGSFLFYSWQDWKRNESLPALIFFISTLAITLQGITDYSFGLHPVIKIYFLMLAMYLKYRMIEENEDVN